MSFSIVLDIGGSHITSGVVDINNETTDVEGIQHQSINSNASADDLLEKISESIINISKELKSPQVINGVGISMPGPLNYQSGLCRITGVNKFDSLFALDLKKSLISILANKGIQIDQISFLNDAKAFLSGVLHSGNILSEKVFAITIGTGIGSASYSEGKFFSGLMDENYLYNSRFKNGRAEDYFSTKWFLNQAAEKQISNSFGVKELAEKAESIPEVQSIFDHFGKNLAEFLNGLTEDTEVDRIIFGGNIFQSMHLFEKSFRNNFSNEVKVQVADKTSEYSLLGAAVHHQSKLEYNQEKVRNSISPVLPVQKHEKESEGYDIYPTFSLGKRKIQTGYHSLMEFIREQNSNQIVIDGNVGTLWDEVASHLNREFISTGTEVNWYCIDAALKPEEEIESMLEGFLGGDDPLFGSNYPGKLNDFFDEASIERIAPSKEKLSIIYGTGAALINWNVPVIYIDQPKNEIQFRSRAGSVSNIGSSKADDAKKMYKRFYFVDWPVCNEHKKDLLSKLTVVTDGQRPGTITWMEGDEFRTGLEKMVKRPFRVRPWFEPGVWGGQWMKDKFEGLNPDAENYAWSFEIIAPENGVIFESDGIMLETGFEFLLYQNNQAVLGQHTQEYGYYFPLRFDYLDTMEGQNLSLQCHPKLEFIRDNFGELITQDETYYIMDAEQDAKVYLGFQKNISRDKFEAEFQESKKSGKDVDVEKYVQTFPSKKHDLFLIPAGTIHCSGKNNLVLEISNTPYIFTFKIYDWQRLDLDGKPRPLNVDRAMKNLNFNRKGKSVEKKLISKPEIDTEGEDWKVINLPTHEEHLYSIQRLEFKSSIQVHTENRFHVLNLVEGDSVNITGNKQKMKLHYGETVIIPAATGSYLIENCKDEKAKIVKAFMK